MCCLVECADVPRSLPSFPTRRSSDLCGFLALAGAVDGGGGRVGQAVPQPDGGAIRPRNPSPIRSRGLPSRDCGEGERSPRDRKSTRLNSSHLGISYAVFCLKKKKDQI